MVKVKDLNDHKDNVCPERRLSCVYCLMVVRAIRMDQHVGFKCTVSPDTAILCVCGETTRRADKATHMQEDVVKHLIALEEKSEMLESKLMAAESKKKKVKKSKSNFE